MLREKRGSESFGSPTTALLWSSVEKGMTTNCCRISRAVNRAAENSEVPLQGLQAPKKGLYSPAGGVEIGPRLLVNTLQMYYFCSVSDKNERKYVSCRTYSVRMCFEFVVFCLCAVRKTKKTSAYVWLQGAMY